MQISEVIIGLSTVQFRWTIFNYNDQYPCCIRRYAELIWLFSAAMDNGIPTIDILELIALRLQCFQHGERRRGAISSGHVNLIPCTTSPVNNCKTGPQSNRYTHPVHRQTHQGDDGRNPTSTIAPIPIKTIIDAEGHIYFKS